MVWWRERGEREREREMDVKEGKLKKSSCFFFQGKTKKSFKSRERVKQRQRFEDRLRERGRVELLFHQ